MWVVWAFLLLTGCELLTEPRARELDVVATATAGDCSCSVTGVSDDEVSKARGTAAPRSPADVTVD